jgi:hypothetical protein
MAPATFSASAPGRCTALSAAPSATAGRKSKENREAGAHTHPDGGDAVVLLIVAAVLAALIGRSVAHALGELLDVVLIVVLSLCALSVVAGIGLILRRRSRAERTTPVPFLTPVQLRAVQARHSRKQQLQPGPRAEAVGVTRVPHRAAGRPCQDHDHPHPAL